MSADLALACGRVMSRGNLDHVLTDILAWLAEYIDMHGIVCTGRDFYAPTARAHIFSRIEMTTMAAELLKLLNGKTHGSTMHSLYKVGICDLLDIVMPDMCSVPDDAVECEVCIVDQGLYLVGGKVYDGEDRVILAFHVTQCCSLIGDLALCTSKSTRCKIVQIANVPQESFPDFFTLQIGVGLYDAIHHSSVHPDKTYGMLDVYHHSTQGFVQRLHEALLLRDLTPISLSCYVRDATYARVIVLSVSPYEGHNHPASAKYLKEYLCDPLNTVICSDVIHVKHCDALPRRAMRDMRCGLFMLTIARILHSLIQ